jgi:DNA-binding transcriptional MerR regulator
MNQQKILFETPKLALNRVEAAEALSVSPATLDRLANRGLIFPCRATGRPLYSIAEIERFLRDTSVEISP